MLPHWPSAGLGATLEEQLQQAALSSGAWGQVQAQLTAEGADPLKVLAAKATFTAAFQSLAAPANGFSLDTSAALDAAKQVTIVGQTVLGAVNTVSGLVHAIDTGSAPQIVQAFTGGLVALAAGAGAISAGIGAAIVAGVGELLNVLESAGLFGQPPTLVEIQGCGVVSHLVPTMMVGCVTGFTDPNLVHIKPGSSTWRHFPRQGTASDRGWFVQGGTYIPQWNNVDWGAPAALNTTKRPIDVAFSNYNWVERGATPQSYAPIVSPFQSGSAFLRGFANAWCANKAFAFNGLKPQDDPQVLVQFLRMWNRAHSSSASTTMRQGGYGSYAESLVTAVHGVTSEFDTSDGGLVVNYGDLSTPPQATGGGLTSSVYGGASAGMSTGAKIAAGTAITGGVVLASSAVYAAATHQSFAGLWGAVWRKVRSFGRK